MTRHCPYCGAELPAPAEGAAQVACPVCAQEIDAPVPLQAGTGTPPPPPPAQTPTPPRDVQATLAEQLGRPEPPPAGQSIAGPAWEGEGGVFGRLWHTTWQFMLHPVRTMAAPAREGYKWPLSYGLILGTLGSAGHLFWSRALGWSEGSSTLALVMMMLAPLQVLVSLYVTAGIIHAMLFILGGAKQGYRATFRALAYTQAAGVWLLVPALGIPLALVWGLVISTGALSAAHGIGKGRAFSAFLLPLILGLLLLGLLAMAVGIGALMAMLGAGKGGGLLPGL